MTNYIKLSDCLTQVPRSLLQESSTIDFLVWMLEALRNLPTITYTYPKIKVFEFDSYKLQLDPEIKQINMVTYLASEPCEEDLDSFASCVENPEAVESDTTTNNICNYTINYKLFLDSVYFKRNYVPLKYSGTGDESMLCASCPNRFVKDCAYTFVVDKDKVLHTTIKEGFLCIDYDTELSGVNCIIPDYAEIKDFLIKYAIMKHWEDRSFTKEESARQMYNEYAPKVDIAFRRARGAINSRLLDPNTIQEINSHTLRRLIKLPETYVYSR